MQPHQISSSQRDTDTGFSNATTQTSRHALPFDGPDRSRRKPSLDCPESITFSNLLSLPESVHTYNTSPLKTPPSFRLFVRQFAQSGLAMGDGTLNVRNKRSSAARPLPLDPPIVCEVIPTQPDQHSLLNVLQVTLRARLVHSDGMGVVAATSAGQPLMGDVDQGAFVAQVYPPQEQSLFIFSELYVRSAGTYRLRFDAIDRSLSSFQPLGSIYSRPFVVVQDKKDFAGLTPSTELILAIVDRGLKLRVIKEAQSQAPAKKKARLMNQDAPPPLSAPLMGPPQRIPPYALSHERSTTSSPNFGERSAPSVDLYSDRAPNLISKSPNLPSIRHIFEFTDWRRG